MIDISQIDYSRLDLPIILGRLFHPRRESRASTSPGQDVLISVEANAAVGARFHLTEKQVPNILFFHGNGEIAADYDDVGPIYNQMGLNFLAVDYRGYGRSTGQPTVTAMMRDCHVVFDFVQAWLQENGYTGPFILMGRSLGSASVLELATHYQDRVDGLIIESGFAYVGPLLKLLGINLYAMGFKEEEGLGNIDKIRRFTKPVLIIHAEFDHIIAFAEGEALYEACPAADKTLLKIPGANHNDVMYRGFREYMAAVKNLAEKLKENK